MTDLCIQSHGGSFSLRAACLILREGRALLVNNQRLQCLYTVGGRIRQGESSAEAARRECLEETGCPLEPERLVFVQERFYTADGCEHHEVVFFYLMQGDTTALAPGIQTDQAAESLCWVPLSSLPELNLLPPFLKNGLQALPGGVQHIVTRE